MAALLGRCDGIKRASLGLALGAGIFFAPIAHAATPASAPSPGGRPNDVIGNEITPEQQEAVQKGLAWLASTQKPDGSFGDMGGYGASAAITALSGIAFMADGNLPGRGKYGEVVRRAVQFTLNSAQQSGLISGAQMQGEMYSHGFATLFLAEVYGMTGDEEVKEKLQRAVQLIEKAQNDEGGWRYQPRPQDADISVTICQVMALRAARDAGIKVEKQVIDNAIRYVRRCQNPDGGFNYMASSGGGGSGFARSAAGIATLYYAGVYEGKEIDRGLDYIKMFTPNKGAMQAATGGHYYYGHYYAVQANFLAGGKTWEAWYPAIRDELIAKQQPRTGNWSGEVNDQYATAMALIILQMPNRYLPVFNGKGPGS
jgi:prenyltransferase beta subunit